MHRGNHMGATLAKEIDHTDDVDQILLFVDIFLSKWQERTDNFAAETFEILQTSVSNLCVISAEK